MGYREVAFFSAQNLISQIGTPQRKGNMIYKKQEACTHMFAEYIVYAVPSIENTEVLVQQDLFFAKKNVSIRHRWFSFG